MGMLVSIVFGLIFLFVSYLWMVFPLYAMGRKTNQDCPSFAFLPILNLVLMLQIAGKDLWWLWLLLVPGVNVLIFAAVWVRIAQALDKPGWLGVLMLVPVVNWFLPFYIAFR